MSWLDYLLGSYQAKVKVDWTLTGISKEESTNIPFSLLFVDQECSLFLKATCVPSYTTISSFKPGKAIKYIAVHLLPLRASRDKAGRERLVKRRGRGQAIHPHYWSPDISKTHAVFIHLSQFEEEPEPGSVDFRSICDGTWCCLRLFFKRGL